MSINIDKTNIKIYLFLSIFLCGCFGVTDPTYVFFDDTISLNSEYNFTCTQDRIADAPFANSSSGVNGFTKETAFHICTNEQFFNIGKDSQYWNRYFIIDQNIDFSKFQSDDFVQIGSKETPFTGVFDGNHKTFYNIYFLNEETSYIGLFVKLAFPAQVLNLKLDGIYIHGDDYLGTIAAINQGGLIDGVEVIGNYIKGNKFLGGIVGVHSTGEIINTLVNFTDSSVSLYGDSYIGGVAGHIEDGSVKNVTVRALNISGTGDFIGGISGVNQTGIIREVNLDIDGQVTGDNNIGGVVGKNSSSILYVTGSINGVRGIENNVGGAVGYNDHGMIYELKLEVTERVLGESYIGGVVGCNFNGEIESINFNGDSITGTSHIGGIVGVSIGGEISSSKSNIIDIVSSSSENVGGLVGLLSSGLMTNIQGAVNEVFAGEGFAGGAIGRSSNSLVTFSSIDVADVVTGKSEVGGFVGENNMGNIYDSFSLVNSVVSISESVYQNNAGGFVGRNIGSNGTNRIEDDSSSEGSYSGGSGENLCDPDSADETIWPNVLFDGGSLSDNDQGRIENSYTVVASSIYGASNIGGFVGHNSGDINTCRTQVKNIIATKDSVGGFVGMSNNITIPTDNCTDDPTADQEDDHYILNSYVQILEKIQGRNGVGGFAGASNDFSFVNTYSNVGSSVQGTGHSTGGYIGYANDSYFAHSFATSNVSGRSEENEGDCVGLFYGKIDKTDYNGSIGLDAYNDTESSHVNNSTTSEESMFLNILVDQNKSCENIEVGGVCNDSSLCRVVTDDDGESNTYCSNRVCTMDNLNDQFCGDCTMIEDEIKCNNLLVPDDYVECDLDGSNNIESDSCRYCKKSDDESCTEVLCSTDASLQLFCNEIAAESLNGIFKVDIDLGDYESRSNYYFYNNFAPSSSWDFTNIWQYNGGSYPTHINTVRVDD
jgi:hypothetical protein